MLKKINFALMLLAILTFRLVLKGATPGDALALAALAALYGWDLYLKSRTTISVNDEVKAELENLKAAITALKLQRSMGR